MLKIILFGLLFSVFNFAFSQTATLDQTFSSGNGASPDPNGTIYSASLQLDGKIIMGGAFNDYNGANSPGIARANTDGSFDLSFNVGSGINGYVLATAIQTDGKIIAGGYFSSYNGTGRERITRINQNGSLDPTFNPGTGATGSSPSGSPGSVKAIAIQSDGKIIIGGAFTSYNGTPRSCIARLNLDGSIDNTFNPGLGVEFSNRVVEAIAIQSDGKIIIGGRFTSYNGTPRSCIARLNVDGSLDSSFDAGSLAQTDFVYSIVIQSDSKIIVGGGFSYSGKKGIARLNPDGTIDPTFNIGVGIDQDRVYSMVLQLDEKVIIGGAFNDYAGVTSPGIARLNTNGSLDNTFNTGLGVTGPTGGYVWSVIVQPDEKIVIGGYFNHYNSNSAKDIARLLNCNPSTGIDIVNACNSYTWIDGVTYNSSINSTYYTITGATPNGCDSIVELDLTITQPTLIQISNVSGTLTASGGVSYSWIDCSTNQPINGQTATTFTPNQPGTYAAISTNAACSDTSDCVTVNTNSINGINKQLVDIQPNPAVNEIIINTDSELLQYEIRSINGKLVIQQENPTSNKCSILHLSAGTYIIKGKTSEGSFTKRIIKR